MQTPTVTVRKAAGPKVKLALPKDFSLEECRALLSRFENQVLTLYAEGHSYSEMAQELSCSVKSIDNAIYRIKSKIRALVPPNS
ncbi:MAG: hypothetical protein IJW46_01545 [Clostridia bacterium]|nr:hypothetical protein [Clostridia bacterium]